MGHELEKLGGSIQQFLGEMNGEILLRAKGTKVEQDTHSIFQKYMDLFDPFLIAELDEERVKETGTERKRISLIHRFLQKCYALQLSSPYLDQFFNIQNQGIEGLREEMSFHDLDFLIPRIPERGERERSNGIRCRWLEGTNEKLETVIKRWHQASDEMGYRSFTEFFLHLNGIETRWITETLDIILDRTEPFYEELIETHLSEMGIDPMKATKTDMLHVIQALRFQSFFPKEGTEKTVRESLDSMGIPLEMMNNIKVEKSAAREAITVPLLVPDEIRLLLNPKDGFRSYLSVYGETGRAMYMGHISPALPMEFRYLGEESVSEAFRLLFQRIISTRTWLRERTDEKGKKAFRRLFLLDRLYHLRRMCSLLRYEMRMHMSAMGEADELYKSIMDENMHLSHPTQEYLLEILVPFRSANLVKAHLLEAMIREALLEKYGEGWYMSPRATDFLKEFWSWGGKFELQELAHYIGYAELDPEPMLEEIEDRAKLI
jgi:hypothetical protein